MNTSTSAQPAKWECTFVRKHAKRKIKYPEGIFLQPELTLFKKKALQNEAKVGKSNTKERMLVWFSFIENQFEMYASCFHRVIFESEVN